VGEADGRPESPRGQSPSAGRSARSSGTWATSGQDALRADLLARLRTPALSVGVEEIDYVREVMVLNVEVDRPRSGATKANATTGDALYAGGTR